MFARAISILIAVALLGCEDEPVASPAATETSRSPIELRLTQSEGGAAVWRAIEASGGIDAWQQANGLSMRFARTAVDRHALDAEVTVDLRQVRLHQRAADGSVELAWTGRTTWATPSETALDDPRYWAVMPYYIVGMPFALATEPATFTLQDDFVLDGEPLTAVHVALDEARGAAPKNFVLLLDKTTHRVRAMRYALRFEGCNPEGGPEHLTTYDGEVHVDGTTFAASHRTFRTDETTRQPTEQMWIAQVRDLAFTPAVDAARFEMPTGAEEHPDW